MALTGNHIRRRYVWDILSENYSEAPGVNNDSQSRSTNFFIELTRLNAS